MNTLETFILHKIKLLEIKRDEHCLLKHAEYNFAGIKCKIFTPQDWKIKFHSIQSQIDILYQCITAYDNKYEQQIQNKSNGSSWLLKLEALFKNIIFILLN